MSAMSPHTPSVDPMTRTPALLALLLVTSTLALAPSAEAAPPSIDSVSPVSGPSTGGTVITIKGKDFAAGAVVEVGTSEELDAEPAPWQHRASNVVVTGTDTVMATVPPHPAALARDIVVRVRNPDGQATEFEGLFGYTQAPTPGLSSVTPSVVASNGGTTVTLNGQNFDAKARFPEVRFGTNADGYVQGVVLNVTATQIQVVAPGREPGIVNVTVEYPNAPVARCTSCFQYASSPRPTVFTIAPTTGPKSGGTLVTITGTDFAPGSQVVFDNRVSPIAFAADEFAAQVVYSSPTQITAMAPALPAGAPAAVRVRVVNPGALEADGSVSAPDSNGHVSDEDVSFNYAAGTSAPTVTSASPARASVAGASNVTLSGTGFHIGANEEPQVLVSPASGTACSTTGQLPARILARTATTLTVEMPPMPPGMADVRVVNPDGGGSDAQSAACKEDLVEYVAPLLVYGLSETQGPTSGGTSGAPGVGALTIFGEGFMDEVTVTFLSGTEAPRGLVTGVGATSLGVIPPPHTKGDVTLVLTNPDGRSATFFRYTYVESPAPILTGVTGSPTSNGGQPLTISGEGFHFGVDPDGDGPLQGLKPKVKIGTADVPAVHIIGGPGVVTSFTVLKAPAQPAGTSDTTKVDVTVTNPDLKQDKSDASADTADQASYSKAGKPTVADTNPLSPTTGPTYGGTLVTLSGTNFATQGARPKVTVGGVAATVVGTPTGTTLQFLTPAVSGLAAAADKDVVLTNPDGQSVTLSDNGKDFDYASTGAATASTLSQGGGPTLGGTVVTISGANLGSVTRDESGAACTGAPDGVPTPAEFNGTKVVGPLPTVEFGGTAAKVLCLVDGDTDLLTVVTPARSATGAVQVVVKANGQTVTASQSFTYATASRPSLATAAETLLPATGGLVRTFAGSGFGPVTRDLDGRGCGDPGFNRSRLATPVPTVRFVSVAQTASTTDTCVIGLQGGGVALEVVTPPHAAGPVNVQVLNPDGFAVNRVSLVRYLPLPPILTGPSAAAVTLNGGTVTFAGVNLPVAPAPLPVLLVGADEDEVLGVGEVVSTTREASGDKGTMVARLPPADGTGLKDAIAIDADGQSGTVNDALDYRLPPAPAFTSASVRTGTLNGNTNLTITGSGFAQGSIVALRAGEGPGAQSYVTDKVAVWDGGRQLRILTPNFMEVPADGRRLTPFDVTIFSPAGLIENPDLECPGSPQVPVQPATQTEVPPVLTNHCLVLPDLFGYSTVVGPRVTAVDPKTGTAGTLVTITGENFAGSPKVHFGAAEATNVTLVSPTTITAKAPAGTGVVDVRVTVAANSDTLKGAFTYTATSSSSTTSSGATTSRSGTSTTGSGLPTVTPEDILEANERISVEVTREGDTNVVSWELPTTGLPGTVAGVQVWGSNSPYSLLQTCATGSSCFTASEFRHTGGEARADTAYLVTMFYGTTQALGFYTQSTAPDTDVYPGTSSEDAGGPQGGDGGGSGGLPNWAIVLIVLGVLFLIVLVAILIARGRNRGARQQTAAQGYAWEETPAAEAQAANAEWDGAQAPEVHQARCPACATTFTATGTKPIVTVCPGCGKKGILR